MIEDIPGFPPHVGAALSLRGGPLYGFNLGDHVGDDPRRVAAHREQFAAAIGARPVWLQQVHGTRVVELQGNESADLWPATQSGRDGPPWPAPS